MAVPVTGSTSLITWDADGAGAVAALNVNKGSTYEYSGEVKTDESGPFFGEPDIIEVPAGAKHGLKLDLVVPEGNDPGQKSMETSFLAKTRGTISAHTAKGRKVTLTNFLITKYTLKGEAKGTQSMAFEGSGDAPTFVDAPTS